MSQGRTSTQGLTEEIMKGANEMFAGGSKTKKIRDALIKEYPQCGKCAIGGIVKRAKNRMSSSFRQRHFKLFK